MEARNFLHDTVTGALPVSSKVAAERPAQPYTMKIVVGEHNRQRGGDLTTLDQMADDPGRHKVRADRDIWLILADETSQRRGVEPIPDR